VRELEFTTKYLIKTLAGLIDSNVFCSALKQMENSETSIKLHIVHAHSSPATPSRVRSERREITPEI
jgi:hypothetical protein